MANLETLTQDVIKSSKLEGEVLDEQQVQSSIARRLGMEIVGLVHSDRPVDGVVKIEVGGWRKNAADDPIQVVSGAMGKLKVQYVAPAAELLENQMELFLTWFNKPGLDTV